MFTFILIVFCFFCLIFESTRVLGILLLLFVAYLYPEIVLLLILIGLVSAFFIHFYR